MRVRLSGMVALLGLAVLGVWVFVPIASGLNPACKITNQATGQIYAGLQSAVNAASPRETLLVGGTCTGTTTVGIDLNLRGQRRGRSAPTLDAGGGGAVLTISDSSRVAISSLMISGGTAGGIVIGAGGKAMLDHSMVSDNSGVFGGGIANNGGTLIVNSSRVTNNTATIDGGGIDTFPAGALTLLGASAINNNTASGNGNPPGNGGGISNGGGTSSQAGLTVTMRDGSRIYNNTAAKDGGGIFNNNGTLNGVVPGANVRRNSPDDVS